MAGKVRVYVATSLDGFLAGPADELDWLGSPSPHHEVPAGALSFEAFMQDVGAMVMGRRTYDVVRCMGPTWFYGDVPVLVATHRPLDQGAPPSVRAVTGGIDALLDEALTVAAGKDVYVDGGATIRAALEAGRVDEAVVTMMPLALGAGIPLFAGLQRRVPFSLVAHVDYAPGVVQLHLRTSR